jgi:hypothetical protein
MVTDFGSALIILRQEITAYASAMPKANSLVFKSSTTGEKIYFTHSDSIAERFDCLSGCALVATGCGIRKP